MMITRNFFESCGFASHFFSFDFTWALQISNAVLRIAPPPPVGALPPDPTAPPAAVDYVALDAWLDWLVSSYEVGNAPT